MKPHGLSIGKVAKNVPLTLAWHFVGATLRGGMPIPKDGEWLIFRGKLRICVSGLHASKRVYDALRYAPGTTLCRVECADLDTSITANKQHTDKFVCSARRILWRMDAAPVLQELSRRIASDVLHLWDAPDAVKNFLATGENASATAAYVAANAAARAASTARAASAARAAASAAAAYVAANAATSAAYAARAAADAADAAYAARAAADAAARAAASAAANAVASAARAARAAARATDAANAANAADAANAANAADAAASAKYATWLEEMITEARDASV